MGYLICEKCEGYYELQPGESPDDFTDKCQCGGQLKYQEDPLSFSLSNLDIPWTSWVAIIFLISIIVIGSTNLYTIHRGFNGHYIAFMSIALIICAFSIFTQNDRNTFRKILAILGSLVALVILTIK